ncbi:MAG: dimethyl sulfoxide reductase anchor subunit [Paracoccaceae bacterium]|nr:dimethyl sulfoxide reductase anchor subunit [Paracoccaceae bacterium]
MHPAPSVIIFTIFSGLGFGLFFLLGLGFFLADYWLNFVLFFLAYGFSIIGLLSSLFHLGNPQRFLKAFSQWRTSWLSREGVFSTSTLIIMAPFAIGKIFLDKEFVILGIVGSVLAILTIFCTAMIYAQLRTVPRWNSFLTPVLFVLYSLGGGTFLINEGRLAAFILILSSLLQVYAWLNGDQLFKKAVSNVESATGLGNIGKVRLLEGPHTGTNYLLKEMVYIVGRKHRIRLRIIGFILVGLLPGLILLLFNFNLLLLILAFLMHLIGISLIRWLFFAEAEHVVGLYY